jgi:ribosomal protein S8
LRNFKQSCCWTGPSILHSKKISKATSRTTKNYKYLRSQKLPNELKKLRSYNTRPDPFAKHWDQIVDMLNRIRNAQVVSHQTVEVPYSNIKYAIQGSIHSITYAVRQKVDLDG